jgi:protein tyrosine/serine phosphatase
MKKSVIVRLFVFLSLMIPAFGVTAALAGGTNVTGIKNFARVNVGLYRGGRPTDAGMRYLQSIHIKTDVNLENEPKVVDHEFTLARALGLDLIPFPMDAFAYPEASQVAQTLATLTNSANFPAFLHCHYGMDRTGLIMGLYRVKVDRWAPARAYQEMLDFGFHPALDQLDRFYRDQTGYAGN